MTNSFLRTISNITLRDLLHWMVALIIALIPVMNGMASPIPSLCIHEFLLLLFSPIALFFAYSSRSFLFQRKVNYWLIYFFAMIFFLLPLSKEGLFVSSVTNISLLTFLVFAYHSDFYRSRVVRAIVFFSALASILVVVQYIGYFIFGTHVSFIPYSFYRDMVFVAYERLMTTGIDNTFFRPSAFFLEPSSMSKYCVLGLFVVMFENVAVKYKTVLLLIITIGILLSTSGMGIIFTAIVWFAFYLKKTFSSNIDYAIRCFIVGCIVVIISLFLFNQVDPLSGAISRINGTGLDGYNAVEGRLGNVVFFSDWSVWDWIVGRGMNSEPDVYFTGLMTIAYRWGMLGIVLFVLSLFDTVVSGMNRTIEQWCLCFLMLFFFATSGVFTAPSMVLFFMFLHRKDSILSYNKTWLYA